jgi:anti-sigma factor RsiW
MDCKFAVKVSMLVDGELSADESEQLRAHVPGCAECEALEKDFLFLRGEIKRSSAGVARKSEIPDLTLPKQIPFWRRGFYVPLPVSLAFLLVFIGLGVWLLASRPAQSLTASAPPPARAVPAGTGSEGQSASLARYDRGGRAEIYVAPRGAE